MNTKAASAMSEESSEKSALVPRLRFPEFRDAEAWKAAQLDKLISTVTPPKKIPATEYFAKGLFPIIDQGQSDIAGWTDDPSALIKDDEPLIIFGDHTCALKVLREPFAQGADGIKILKGNGPATTEFLYQHLCFRPVLPEEYKRHFSILRDKVIAYPEAKSGEQQKIADCLSSLDDLIMAETQKLDALKTHKKGLMQQLFPREGETVPRLRFPEFQEAGEWAEKSIGDFGEVITGSTPSTARPEFYGGGIPFVSPADISDLRWVNDTKTTLTASGFEEIRPIKANSVLFVCIGSTIGKVTQNIRDCATNQQINSVIPNTEHSGGFLYYALSLNAERIANLAGIQAVPIINKTQFSAVRLPVPELPEQERIADCLSFLDDLITAQSKKIDAFKAHKKGLMQQLFPVVDEVQE